MSSEPQTVGPDAYREVVSEMVRESRAAQGLPASVEDSAALARIRAVMRDLAAPRRTS